ncbi:DUF5776 domain-containing protein [Apilactobacillus ozensis]|uniref:DUF5776 domain-containing protein n=1 Tax=Apilactobacillus ozensis TaxID=866801 RepID=UPI00200ACFDE|nr:DUF5776 domain-containing protein [Apilactobacillus ozensis]MCK8607405.1 DUF5776 domain-containing protein [Apilactobacillus ozensis]
MKKNALALLISSLVAVSLIIFFKNNTMQAANYQKHNETSLDDLLDDRKHFNININEEGYITGFLNDDKGQQQENLTIPNKVYIPSEDKSIPVIGVKENAFKNSNISIVALPYDIKYIGTEAFANTNVKKLMIYSSKLAVGDNIIGSSSDEKEIDYYGDSEEIRNQLEKSYHVNHLNHKDNPEAEAKAKQKAEDKAKQKAEAKAKQEAEAKAKQEAEAKAKQKAENDKNNEQEGSNKNANNNIFDFNYSTENIQNDDSKNTDKKANNNQPSVNIDDKKISKNKSIFHKYTKSFKVMKINGNKDIKVTNFTKNSQKDFITSNGQILSSKKYIRTYQQSGNVKKVKVINNGGINVYSKIKFNDKFIVKHVNKNKTFKVVSTKHLNHDITRYKLSNGQFITTNRHFVKPIK